MSDKPQKTLTVMRQIIDRIELEPNTISCDIQLKVLVDGVRLYKAEVEGGRALSWENVLACDVWDGTKITIQLQAKPRWYTRIPFTQRNPNVVRDFYVDGGVGLTVEQFDIKLNSIPYNLNVHGKFSQLNDQESDKFVAEMLPVLHGINRELGPNNLKLSRKKIISAFNLPTEQVKRIKNYYRIVPLFSGRQGGILQDMLHVLKTRNVIPKYSEGLKTIRLYEMARHELHDKVFFIENRKYRTGVKVTNIANGEPLTGSILCKEETTGHKWRFMKYDGELENWYLIGSEDHKDRFAGVGDEFVQLNGIETWWTLEPVGEHTGHYIIKQRNKDFCWTLEDSENGTPLKLKRCSRKDESNHWSLRLAEDE